MNVTYGQLANVALAVMVQTKVKSDDQTLSLVLAARQMLHRIAAGELLVNPPAPPAPAAPPVAGAEGVVPGPTAEQIAAAKGDEAAE
jgi:hypothetical protein